MDECTGITEASGWRMWKIELFLAMEEVL